MEATRAYAGRSAQERRDDRRRKLLDAGLELIGNRGWAETSVRGVYQHAGVSPRFFYESFDNRDALAVALFDEIVDDATGRVISAIAAAGDDREAQARAAMRTLVDALVADPRRARVVFVEALGSEPLARRRRQMMHDLATVIGTLGEAGYDARRRGSALARMTSAVVAGGLVELLVAWLDASLDVTEEQLVRDGAALVVGLGDTANALARRPAAR
jgi:AcrR family transcriptional regulator